MSESSVWKFALCGNSCVGKTTVMHYAFAQLKLAKFHVGSIADLARNIPFPPATFDISPEARLHVLFKQMAEETGLAARKDVNVIVSERCILDWWLHYLWTCENVGVTPSMRIAALVGSWMKSYDGIFFLTEIHDEYTDDGFRGPLSLREQLRPMYLDFVKSADATIHIIEAPTFEERCTAVTEGMLVTLKDCML